MYYGSLKETDIANGPGVRVSLFVSGCQHHCKGCFQPETWDYHYGQPYTAETQKQILTYLGEGFIDGLTLLGGEPFDPLNQPELTELLRKVRDRYPEKTVWCYTGYTYDVDLVEGGAAYTSYTEEMLSMIDVLVDGEFVLEEKDISLTFRGSRNQRILHLKENSESK